MKHKLFRAYLEPVAGSCESQVVMIKASSMEIAVALVGQACRQEIISIERLTGVTFITEH